MIVQFDFSELLGRIIARFGTRKKFAQAVPMSEPQLSDRLQNKVPFKPDEIIRICKPDVLDIPAEHIGRYFFTPKV